MATNGRTRSSSGTAPRTTPAPSGKPEQPEPKAPEKLEPKASEALHIEIDTPVERDPVVETTPDPKRALAASKADLARLQAARRARVIKAGILTAIALILITFVLQNAEPVGIRLLAWTMSMRLIWVIVVSTLLGAVAGYLVGRPDKRLFLHGPHRRDEDPS